MPQYRSARLTIDGGTTYSLRDVYVSEASRVEREPLMGMGGRVIGPVRRPSRTRIVLEAEAVPEPLTLDADLPPVQTDREATLKAPLTSPIKRPFKPVTKSAIERLLDDSYELC